MHTENNWRDVETALGSVGRLRILRMIIRNPEEYFTKYALEKATGLKPVDLRSDLKVLVGLDWVREYAYDPRTYRINLEKDIVKLIAELFQNIT